MRCAPGCSATGCGRWRWLLAVARPDTLPRYPTPERPVVRAATPSESEFSHAVTAPRPRSHGHWLLGCVVALARPGCLLDFLNWSSFAPLLTNDAGAGAGAASPGEGEAEQTGRPASCCKGRWAARPNGQLRRQRWRRRRRWR
eukprot:COSAG01_NODE_7970_length_2970_cov_1.643330_2_plen_143_part_00